MDKTEILPTSPAIGLLNGPPKYLVLVTGKDFVRAIVTKQGLAYPMTYPFNKRESAEDFIVRLERLFPNLTGILYKIVQT